jgi:N-[(2S)-2-amino-2-carboxyethyl]-L-glutamate dehydrogenase
MNQPDLLYFSEDDVQEVITPSLVQKALKQGLTLHANGDCDQPPKPYVRPRGRENESEGGRFICMPAYVGHPIHCAGVKWIAGFSKNIDKGKPRAAGIILLNSADTGMPFAIMQGATISADRTAGVAAICIDLFRKPGRNKVAILGAGPIARATIQALASQVRHIESITVYDLRVARTKELAASLAQLGSIPIYIGADVQSCVEGADVVISATTAKEAYIQREWLLSCGLIVAFSFEDFGEEVLLSADKVIVDDFNQCNREEKLLHRLVQSGRFGRERVYAELGQIVSGQIPGRTRDDELIYVNPMGMAIEDIAVACAVYDAAIAAGLGKQLNENPAKEEHGE